MGLGVEPDLGDPDALVGRLALQLARQGSAGLPVALGLLVEHARLGGAVLRRADKVLAAAGEVGSAPGLTGRSLPAGTVAIPVPDPSGDRPGCLCVTGARPSALPLLRDVAVVLGLVLDAPVPALPPTAVLLDDVDSERAALADLLHDGPVQELLAVRYAVDAARRSGTSDVAGVREAVQTALVALRRTMVELRPRGADGLAPALHGLSDRLVDAGGAALHLRVAGDADRLLPAASAAAYRLVQAVAGEPSPSGARVVLQVGRGAGGVPAAVLTVEGGAALTDRPRWRRTAAALGGDLLCTTGRLHLTLPLPAVPSTPLPDLRGRADPPRTSLTTTKAAL